jgi:RNA polymerase sigma-70 factor (ECF subfamily)
VDTDRALIDAYLERGDQDAFAELVRRYRESVFRLAVSILGPAYLGEAEEIAQEVFVRVHRALASFRGDAQLGSWIYRIAFNQAINLKQRVRYRAPHLPESVLVATASPGSDPLDQLEAGRRQRALLECVDELPDIYQSVLRLHYWMGASIAEIAELIGVPENSVKSYLHRARRLLHAMLEERGMRDV